MVTNQIKDFLAISGVWCSVRNHPVAHTAQEVAQAIHVSGSCLAKNVIVVVDGQLAMAVVPANREVDLDVLRVQSYAENVRLAEPSEFAGVFGDSELGAAPPFGNLFGVNTYVDIKLALQPQILFNSGKHTEVVRMSFADYRELVKPYVLLFAKEHAIARRHISANRFRKLLVGQSALREEFDAEQVQCGCEPTHHLGAD